MLHILYAHSEFLQLLGQAYFSPFVYVHWKTKGWQISWVLVLLVLFLIALSCLYIEIVYNYNVHFVNPEQWAQFKVCLMVEAKMVLDMAYLFDINHVTKALQAKTNRVKDKQFFYIIKLSPLPWLLASSDQHPCRQISELLELHVFEKIVIFPFRSK